MYICICKVNKLLSYFDSLRATHITEKETDEES